MADTHDFGQWGERVAAWYLEKKGYTILFHHYTCRFGEIDLVAKKENELVFVEVKTRSTAIAGEPEDAVSARKLAKLYRAIAHFLINEEEADPRIDVVAVMRAPGAKKVTVRHHEAIHHFTAPPFG